MSVHSHRVNESVWHSGRSAGICAASVAQQHGPRFGESATRPVAFVNDGVVEW